MSPMRISVIVPTYRRPEVLSSCLKALSGQDRPPDEVIVVVRREDRSSLLVAGRYKDWARVVPIDVPAGSPGVVMALNAGVAASSGEIVCLTDDDAQAHPDWIARILDAFDLDPRIGAVGGRDLVFHDGRLEDGEKARVGMVGWFGRTAGNHHLGVGGARDVDVLKGVNLSVRGDLIREVGFDTRLRAVTTEHHWELGLCLRLLRMGYRVVYDPAIAVDHHPQPRVAEDRERRERDVRDAAHNETLAMLEHLSLPGKATHLAWTTGVGSRAMPGLVSSFRTGGGNRGGRLALLRGNLGGRAQAVVTFARSRSPARLRSGVRSESGDDGTGGLICVCDSPGAAARARQLLAGAPKAKLVVAGPGAMAALRGIWSVLASDAPVLYLVDIGKATAPLAILGRLLRKRVVVDTGDAVYALARSLGDRGFAGMLLVGLGEKLALRSAHRIVVRGRAHAALVPGPATQIPDLAPACAGPVDAGGLRHSLGLDGAFVVGLVGSLILSPRRGTAYGWDLIEALPRLDPSVIALIVGDGTGLEPLRERADMLGVSNRCRFVGSVPADEAHLYVSAMNAAISTQTNDVVGRVRTTGKLPLYLACGCPVIASDVGEAAVLLGPHGWTLSYNGVVDESYPARLAALIEAWRSDPAGEAERRGVARQIFAAEFDAGEMRERLRGVIAGVRVSR
jgi:GT2 family glycosyltransferase